MSAIWKEALWWVGLCRWVEILAGMNVPGVYKCSDERSTTIYKIPIFLRHFDIVCAVMALRCWTLLPWHYWYVPISWSLTNAWSLECMFHTPLAPRDGRVWCHELTPPSQAAWVSLPSFSTWKLYDSGQVSPALRASVSPFVKWEIVIIGTS